MRLRYTLMIFTGMGALACATFGIDGYRTAERSSHEPEEISLRDLIKRGPEGNPNIILTDFSIFEDYVYQKKRLSGKWTKVWVPIIPTDEETAGVDSPAIRAFLFSEDIGSDREVRMRFGRPRLRGMVNPHAPKPGFFGERLLKKSYPGTDPNKCLIIEEGKEPASTLKLTLLGVGSVLLTGLTGGIWYLARAIDKEDAQPKPANKPQPTRGKNQEGPEPIFDAIPVDDADQYPPRK
ncbi:MAG TPA: hypothetical protein VN688_28955 [Gemmataceae bacterium]|nr:hypothetical protein [Gemmataceae bacterium]